MVYVLKSYPKESMSEVLRMIGIHHYDRAGELGDRTCCGHEYDSLSLVFGLLWSMTALACIGLSPLVSRAL